MADDLLPDPSAAASRIDPLAPVATLSSPDLHKTTDLQQGSSLLQIEI